MIIIDVKRLAVILAVVAAILLIPFIAMQFTGEVNWSGFDFVVMGVLLFALGVVIDLVITRVGDTTKKIVYLVITGAIFLLIWAELAVGVFGTPFAGN